MFTECCGRATFVARWQPFPPHTFIAPQQSLNRCGSRPPHSRGAFAPECCWKFPHPPNRGRREYRVRAAPTVSCAKNVHKNTHTSIQVSGNTPAFPAQWFYSLFISGSPRCTELDSHRHRQCLNRQLDTSVGVSGPHDFAVRLRRFRQRRLQRPPLPVPAFEDDRERPSGWDGMAADIEVIWVGRQVKNSEIQYFFNRANHLDPRPPATHVRYRGQRGSHVLALSFSGFDPLETSGGPPAHQSRCDSYSDVPKPYA